VATGTIKSIVDRGYGFITPADGGGKDIFFHNSSVAGHGFDQLREGMRVSYDQETDPRDSSRLRATRVTPLTDSAE
jgi:CspA family cold shock protein